MDATNLKLIIFNSFLGAIANNIRAIAYDFTSDTILIYGYLDVVPEEDDFEIIDNAVTEIMSSCPEFLKQEINLKQSNQPFGKLNSYKGWVFCRYEE
ncbi:hypothetical protein B9T33_10955 [Acinetobacter sp. ANC 5054]|nr:hypothetical protein B9T33_10955 [Acinetobacter sp. ANC 5054]